MSGVSRRIKTIQPCPVCGKKPRITCSGSPGHGAWCTIQCKPIFRKPHLKVESGKALLERALVSAASRWNYVVSNMKGNIR